MKHLRILCLTILMLSCQNEKVMQSTLQIGTELGKVDTRISEASGLVASITNPGYLWTINDSGNPAEVFLIDRKGSIKLICTLAEVNNRDWEEITIGKAEDGKNYLYIADIGDNFSNYTYKLIYRMEEPILSADNERTITKFDTYLFRWPEVKQDAETILVDPCTSDIFILSKSYTSTAIYKAPHQLVKDTMDLEKVLTFPLNQIVAGSISSDGRFVLLKSYQKIYFWERAANESLVEVFSKTPMELPYEPEPQGEGIAWDIDGTRFYTLSESTWLSKASLIMHKKDTNLYEN